ncbi:MAG: hypothetical protein OHK0039_16140 [Bacteroidia bacterium]
MRYYILIGLLAIPALFMLPGCGGGGGAAGKIVERGATRGANRLLRQGQRALRRSVRELTKTQQIPLEEKETLSRFRIIATDPSELIAEHRYEGYYFNLLTDIVAGEYDVNPETGVARHAPAARAVLDIVDTLRSGGKANPDTRVLLLVSHYGDYGPRSYGRNRPPVSSEDLTREFLAEQGRQRVLADSLNALLVQVGGAGIVIDFPRVPADAGEDFERFVRRLKGWTQGLVYVKLPAPGIGGTGVYQPDLLRKLVTGSPAAVDAFILKGYDLQRGDTLSSPAPLRSRGEQDIARSVNAYLEAGGDPRLLVVELPFYGLAWTAGPGRQYRLRTYRQRLPFADIPAGKRVYDPDSNYVVVSDRSGETFYTYDDARTLAHKYRWVKSSGLGGISILGPGYYAEGSESWEVLAGVFGANPPRLVYPALAFLLLFLGGGIVFSVIQYWEVRNEIARKRSHQWFYGLALLMVGVVFLCCMVAIIPKEATAGSSIILVLFPFLRRWRSMGKRFGIG